MDALSGTEIALICVLLLLSFGVKNLPLFCKSLRRSMEEFQQARREHEQRLQQNREESGLRKPGSLRRCFLRLSH